MRTGAKGIRAEAVRTRNGVPRADTPRCHIRGVSRGSPLCRAPWRGLAGERALEADWAARVAVRMAADGDAVVALRLQYLPLRQH